MTKSSRARIERRLGRPLKDSHDDPDSISIEFAMALRRVWGMSERAAFDWVITQFESRAGEPTKTPRGAGKHPGGLIIGYETSPLRTVSGRAATLRQKSKRHRARPDVVAALTLALRCRDI